VSINVSISNRKPARRLVKHRVQRRHYSRLARYCQVAGLSCNLYAVAPCLQHRSASRLVYTESGNWCQAAIDKIRRTDGIPLVRTSARGKPGSVHAAAAYRLHELASRPRVRISSSRKLGMMASCPAFVVADRVMAAIVLLAMRERVAPREPATNQPSPRRFLPFSLRRQPVPIRCPVHPVVCQV